MKPNTLHYAYEFIKLVEGEVLSAYQDSEGITTIGIGITASFMPGLKLGDSITQEQSQLLFEKAVVAFVNPLSKMRGWDNLTSTQQAALISFAFNTGYYPGHPDFQTLNRALNPVALKAREGVPKTFMLYINPGSPSELGLKRRRRAEGLLWYGNTPQKAYSIAWKEIL